jgi:hypothetical protein
MYFLKKLLNLKGDDGFIMNQVLVAEWYIMGLWPLVYSMLLLPTGRRYFSILIFRLSFHNFCPLVGTLLRIYFPLTFKPMFGNTVDMSEPQWLTVILQKIQSANHGGSPWFWHIYGDIKHTLIARWRFIYSFCINPGLCTFVIFIKSSAFASLPNTLSSAYVGR